MAVFIKMAPGHPRGASPGGRGGHSLGDLPWETLPDQSLWDKPLGEPFKMNMYVFWYQKKSHSGDKMILLWSSQHLKMSWHYQWRQDYLTVVTRASIH